MIRAGLYDALALPLGWLATVLYAATLRLHLASDRLRWGVSMADIMHAARKAVAPPVGYAPVPPPPPLPPELVEAAAVSGSVAFHPAERSVTIALRPGWRVEILADEGESLRVPSHGLELGAAITVIAGRPA